MSTASVRGEGKASGRPGMALRWTSSSREGVGTAYSTSSRGWFTISHGILNEFHCPTGNSALRLRSAGSDILVSWRGSTHLAPGTNVGFTQRGDSRG